MPFEFDKEALTLFQLDLDKNGEEVDKGTEDREVPTKEQKLQKYVWALQNLYRHLSGIQPFQLTSLNNDLVTIILIAR